MSHIEVDNTILEPESETVYSLALTDYAILFVLTLTLLQLFKMIRSR